jgi:hypothetical protein
VTLGEVAVGQSRRIQSVISSSVFCFFIFFNSDAFCLSFPHLLLVVFHSVALLLALPFQSIISPKWHLICLYLICLFCLCTALISA